MEESVRLLKLVEIGHGFARGATLRGMRVLVLGIAYKKDIDDLRESPALDIIELLRAKGADVRYHDPYVPVISHNGHDLTCEPALDAALVPPDLVRLLVRLIGAGVERHQHGIVFRDSML